MLETRSSRAVLIALFLAMAPSLSGVAHAHGGVDQIYHPASFTQFFCPISPASLFQGFKPTGTPLVAVDVYVDQFAAATVTVRVRDLSPDGPVLATASAAFAAGGTAERHLDLPTPLAVIPGRTYVLELVFPPTGSFTWRGNDPGGYPDGQAYGCGGAPSTADFQFATYSSGCTTGDTNLCLNGGRFRVKAQWRTDSASGQGHAVALTDDTGYFWFFGADNVELVVKVLNACGVNDRFWVFAGGLTDQEVTWTVTDTLTDTTKSYQNPLGRVWQTVTDTDALGVCP